jgi:hypothetical protein
MAPARGIEREEIDVPFAIMETPSISQAEALNASQLRRRCDPAELP